MAYDKRFKRFQEFVEAAWYPKPQPLQYSGGWKPMGAFANPSRYQRCSRCGGSGESETGPGAIGWGNSAANTKRGRCWVCQGTGQELKEDGAAGGAPANSVGGGGVAGLGVPAGSKFGEHPQQAAALGGATTKTKKKNKRPEDLKEDERPRYSPTNRRPVGQLEIEFSRIRTNGTFGGLVTYYVAKTLVPVASGTVKFGVESKNAASVQDAFADLKDKLINKYFVTGTLKIKRSWSDPVLNRELDKLNIVEGFGDWVKGKQMSDRDARAVIANATAALDVWPDKDLPQLKRLLAAAKTGGPSAVVRLRQFLRDNGVVYEWDQAPDPIEGGEKLTEAKAVDVTFCLAGSGNIELHKAGCKDIGRRGKYQNTWTEKLKGGSVKDIQTQAVASMNASYGWHPGDEESPPWDEDTVTPHNCCKQLKEDRETFAGAPVFEVDTDKWMKSRFGKNRYHRYSKYVGEDEQGEEIRQHGRTQRKSDIILKDQATGAMTWFLRRKKAGQ